MEKQRNIISPIFRTKKEINHPKTNNSQFRIRDILIPIISAVLAVALNQFYFESNKRIEAQIEFDKENYKTQLPVLNRILAFTNKYESFTIIYCSYPVVEKEYYDSKTGEFVKREKQVFTDKADTIKITVPSFIFDLKKRSKFFDDIETLSKQRDLLDNEIYIAFDYIIEFIDDHKLPNLNKQNEIVYSEWKEKKVQDEWIKLMGNLREVCLKKVETFKNSSR